MAGRTEGYKGRGVALSTQEIAEGVAEVPDSGVWRFEDGFGWARLTPANASRLDADGNGDVAVEIPGAGVWRFEDATGWAQLTPADASQLSYNHPGGTFSAGVDG
jgi:hypothetical protein